MNDPNLVSMLYADYGTTHFLINREQAPASVYADNPRPWASGYPYLDDRLVLGEEEIPLFNLHRYLSEMFQLKTEIKDLLVLLVPLALLGAETESLLRRGPLAEEKTEIRRLGVRVSSETQIRDIPLGELKPQARCLNGVLKRAGLAAVHLRPRTLGYLLDIPRAVAAVCRRPL